MGKDFKEKFERVCAVKDKAISLVETQLNGDLSRVDAQELGYVSDIAKDFSEIMEKCAKAEYYFTVTEAMKDSDESEKKYYMDKYIPEYEGKFYTPVPMTMARARDSRGRYMYTEPMMHDDRMDDDYRDRMYYSSMTGNSGSKMNMNDSKYGQSYISRRGYMEAKEMGDHDKKSKELEKYMHDLADDLTEMFEGLDSSDKSLAKQKLSQLVSKM